MLNYSFKMELTKIIKITQQAWTGHKFSLELVYNLQQVQGALWSGIAKVK